MMDPSSSAAAAAYPHAGDSIGGGGGGGGVPFVSAWIAGVSRRYQHLLDKSTPHVLRRWLGFALLVFIYVVRVAIIQGFYVVSYALGIYVLNLFIAFLSPQVDPEIQELVDETGPALPTRSSDEFRPFVRRLPEFKFWYFLPVACIVVYVLYPCQQLVYLRRTILCTYPPFEELPSLIRYSITKAFCIAFVLTFFSAFDVPVFWPVLVFYWFVLFVATMKRQILHMIKYKYVPFSTGKQRYGKKPVSAQDAGLPRP